MMLALTDPPEPGRMALRERKWKSVRVSTRLWRPKDESARKFLLPIKNGASAYGQKSVAALRGVIRQGRRQ